MADTLDCLMQRYLAISDHPFAFASSRVPTEILIAIFELLFYHFDELYAPLVCSHVCTFWRQIILGIPEFWSIIDNSRGLELTELWLKNSRDTRLNVRLWNRPPDPQITKGMGGLVDASERLTMDPVFDVIKAEVLRWRSLDIAFSCISHTSKVTQYLADLKETVHLDSLTIGPMGLVSLLIDDDTIGGTYPGTVFRSADPTQAKSLLQQTNIQPVALRIDTYPIAFSPVMFSRRLTILEVFAGNYYTHSPDLNEWHQILSSTPQLVNLRLWSPRHWKIDLVESKMFMPLHLVDLQVLELAGSFIILGPLFVKASLPMLDHLLLDSLGTSISVPQQVAEFASVSPTLTRLHVGSVCFSPDSISSVWWTKAFESMHSLQALSLVEMEWLEAASALIQLSSTSHRLSHIVLKGIWDIDPATLARLQAADSGLPPLEIIDCTTGQPARCVDLEHIAKGCDCDLDTRSNGDSDTGSNYSDNSSFEYTNGFPSSVFDSEGSEISYGEDEGSEMGLAAQQ